MKEGCRWEELITEREDFWQWCGRQTRPVVLYGMGNGGDKLFDACQSFGITIRGVFASAEFVRKKAFHGFPVESIERVGELFEDPIILLGFGTSIPDMLEMLRQLSLKHTVLAPDLPLFGTGLFTEEYAREHWEEISRAYRLLADEKSRAAFRDVLNFKLSGKLSYLWSCQSPKKEAYRLLELSGRESYVDLGAYNGDTLREMLQEAGGVRRALLLEPDPKNFKKLSSFLEELTVESRALQAAAWEKRESLSFAGKSGRGGGVQKDGIMVQGLPLDDIPEGKDASVIKMDVEGSEEKALFGCAQILKNNSPKLIVSAYHRNEDLFALPLLIQRLRGDCKIYLRHHPYVPAWETNLYVR